MSGPLHHHHQANVFAQPIVGLSRSGSARPMASAAEHLADPLRRHDPPPAQRPRPPKRSNITPVACQPCQQRKHKCDGVRPVCTPCQVKKRADCAYDAAGDQRRTSALKQRIQDLEMQVEDLKDIIASIGSAPDRDTAINLAHQLAHERFRNVAEVAQALRSDQALDAASFLATGHDDTLRPAAPGHVPARTAPDASPSSVATGDSVEYDSMGATTLSAWPMDATQGEEGLMTREYGDASLEASGTFWPPDTSMGSVYMNVPQPIQFGPRGHVGAGGSMNEMNGEFSNIQTGAEMPGPFW